MFLAKLFGTPKNVASVLSSSLAATMKSGAAGSILVAVACWISPYVYSKRKIYISLIKCSDIGQHQTLNCRKRELAQLRFDKPEYKPEKRTAKLSNVVWSLGELLRARALKSKYRSTVLRYFTNKWKTRFHYRKFSLPFCCCCCCCTKIKIRWKLKMIKYKYILIECIFILLNINVFINTRYFSFNVNIFDWI